MRWAAQRRLARGGSFGPQERKGSPRRGRARGARTSVRAPLSRVSAQNWTDTASEKLELAPSRYHIWKVKLSPGWMLGAGMELPAIQGS